MVISETDISAKKKRKTGKIPVHSGKQTQSFRASVGDFVVHENHGLGGYRGTEKMEANGVVKDYIKIEYAGKVTCIFSPPSWMSMQNMLVLECGKDKLKLNKLGGQEWKKDQDEGAAEL